jgi:hypothetical protein
MYLSSRCMLQHWHRLLCSSHNLSCCVCCCICHELQDSFLDSSGISHSQQQLLSQLPQSWLYPNCMQMTTEHHCVLTLVTLEMRTLIIRSQLTVENFMRCIMASLMPMMPCSPKL